jgi:hypothetical protein
MSITTQLSAIPTALISSPIPAGFDTCWSFLARTEPATLAVMTDPVGGLVDDDRKAQQTARAMGETFAMIAAPEALRAIGTREVGVYPAVVLERVFPVNP